MKHIRRGNIFADTLESIENPLAGAFLRDLYYSASSSIWFTRGLNKLYPKVERPDENFAFNIIALAVNISSVVDSMIDVERWWNNRRHSRAVYNESPIIANLRILDSLHSNRKRKLELVTQDGITIVREPSEEG